MSKRVCCMSLYTAGIVIGCLDGIWSLLKIVGLSMSLKYFLNEKEEKFDIVIISSTFLAINAIKVICSILLLVGTIKNHHFLVLPWIIATAFDILNILCTCFYRLCTSTPTEPGEKALFMMSFGVTMGVNIFIYNTIFALYNHIKDIRKQQLPMILENEDQ